MRLTAQSFCFVGFIYTYMCILYVSTQKQILTELNNQHKNTSYFMAVLVPTLGVEFYMKFIWWGPSGRVLEA